MMEFLEFVWFFYVMILWLAGAVAGAIAALLTIAAAVLAIYYPLQYIHLHFATARQRRYRKMREERQKTMVLADAEHQ